MCVCEACVGQRRGTSSCFWLSGIWHVAAWRGRLANCVASPKPTYVRTQAYSSSFGVTSQNKDLTGFTYMYVYRPVRSPLLSLPLCAAEHSHQLQIYIYIRSISTCLCRSIGSDTRTYLNLQKRMSVAHGRQKLLLFFRRIPYPMRL